MCGLFGMIGTGIVQVDLDYMYDVGYVSALRGKDGTGIVQGQLHEKFVSSTMKKNDTDFNDFMWYHHNCKEGDKKLLNDQKCNFFLGHVRHATKGAINEANTHPFEIEHLVGMHNGTLKELKYDHKDKTDSELLLKDIAVRGPLAPLRELADDSAYALVYLDKINKQIIIARNTKRTLFCTFHQYRNVFYYASEVWMLEAIAERHNLSIGGIFRFEPGYIHKITPKDVQKNRLPSWKILPIAKPEPVIVQETNPLLLPSPNNVVPLLDGLRAHRARIQVAPEVAEEFFEEPDTNNHNRGKKRRPRGQKRLREDFIEACRGCKMPLDPFEQYGGRELPNGGYMCSICVSLEEDINKRLH